MTKRQLVRVPRCCHGEDGCVPTSPFSIHSPPTGMNTHSLGDAHINLAAAPQPKNGQVNFGLFVTRQTDVHCVGLFFFLTLPVIHHPPWFKADPKTETKRIPDNGHVLAAAVMLSEPESRKKFCRQNRRLSLIPAIGSSPSHSVGFSSLPQRD